jgi:ABC-2 type transport system permease protein
MSTRHASSLPPPALTASGAYLAQPNPWWAAAALAAREIVRFFRQRSRIIGSIGTPLVFWLLFGAGLSGSFRVGTGASGQDFLTYFFPGSLLLIVLFTAIFSSISIIEDRREGFLQGVLVAPIPRWAMVLGKVLGGTAVAVAQGLIFLLLGLLLPIEISPLAAVQVVLLLIVAALALTSLGTFFAWKTDSSQGFHAIMNLVLMPLWLLSGAFFPAPASAADTGWSAWLLHAAMRLNPLSYAVGGVRRLLAPAADFSGVWVPGLAVSWLVTAAFAVVAFGLAVWISREPAVGDLQ